MTPQEKAKQLVEKMYVKYEPKIEDKSGIYYFNMSFDIAKQSALIAVDEMLKHDEKIIVSHKISSYKTANDFDENFKHIQNELNSYVLSRYSYWQEVKQEINKL